MTPLLPFPWGDAIGFGLGILKLSPDAFWRMTPRELAHAISGARGATSPPMMRSDFDALIRAFPDEVHDGR